MAMRLASPGAEAKADLTPETINRECAGATDTDDFGNEFELCPDNDHGHLYLNGWCVHCHREECK